MKDMVYYFIQENENTIQQIVEMALGQPLLSVIYGLINSSSSVYIRNLFIVRTRNQVVTVGRLIAISLLIVKFDDGKILIVIKRR